MARVAKLPTYPVSGILFQNAKPGKTSSIPFPQEHNMIMPCLTGMALKHTTLCRPEPHLFSAIDGFDLPVGQVG